MTKARIMVVEDESIIGRDLEQTLKGFGYTVPAIVSSGEEAVRIAREDNLDLVLMDIGLDGEVDGIRAAKEIQSQFDIPVIFISASPEGKLLRQAKKLEHHGYINKPFEDGELRTAIEKTLGRDN